MAKLAVQMGLNRIRVLTGGRDWRFFDILASSFFRHSSFGFRHFYITTIYPHKITKNLLT